MDTDEDHDAAQNSFVSIDTWEEVLDSPPTHSLVRASSNWAARLALLAVVLQNSARCPEFSPDDGRDGETDEEVDTDVDAEGDEWEDTQSGNITRSGHDEIRVAVLEDRENVCWVCLHRRLTKKGWLASQEPCFVVI